jgi:hypothetical protein
MDRKPSRSFPEPALPQIFRHTHLPKTDRRSSSARPHQRPDDLSLRFDDPHTPAAGQVAQIREPKEPDVVGEAPLELVGNANSIAVCGPDHRFSQQRQVNHGSNLKESRR